MPDQENQENSIKFNRFWRPGWLGPGIWQAKSSKMMENPPKIFKKTFLFFVKISRKSTRLLLGPARADSGEPTTAELAELGLPDFTGPEKSISK